MKATSNQLLIAASNILSGMLSPVDCKVEDYHIQQAIELAQKIADLIPDEDDILKDDKTVTKIVEDAMNSFESDKKIPSSLLSETIRKEHHFNRTLSVAIIQRALMLGIIENIPTKNSKVVLYSLKKKRNFEFSDDDDFNPF